ncbi:MAG: DoxX family protein [Rhodospirillales bacterium]|nr:DoxX family protein [Rhodospirillales bacterium]
MQNKLAALRPYALSLLRFMAGLLYMEHGTAKLLGFPAIPAFAHVQLASLIGVAGVLELVGGTLIMLGLFTRIAAFVLSGEMAFAYFIAHAPHGFLPILNHGELAVLYCFTFLYLAVAGGGPIALERVFCRTAARA